MEAIGLEDTCPGGWGRGGFRRQHALTENTCKRRVHGEDI